ncbi:MAG: LysM peptidoglycan-binding domain-containing protein [Ignavibacteria bacterium]|nr:LysM peptidoglycan-binding domain-containing protein [Ignavibacteria bacterium]
MKSNKLFLAILILSLIAFFKAPVSVHAQDDGECCDEMDDACGTYMSEWARYSKMKDSLNAVIASKQASLDGLTAQKNQKQSAYDKLKGDFNSWVGEDIDAFRKRFADVESQINSRTGNCEDAKKKLDAITASKGRCLNEFWDRYNAMVKKYADWCLGGPVAKKCDKDYTVVKGDCLWKIAGKSSIYGNPRLWPKIWDANKNGIISGTPSTIPNPNRIYPGQVLCIPSMTDAEKQMMLNKSKGTMKKRKSNYKGDAKFDNTKKDTKKDASDIKKDEKKDVKKDEKKDVKKEAPKDVKKDAPKDVKKEEKKK